MHRRVGIGLEEVGLAVAPEGAALGLPANDHAYLSRTDFVGRARPWRTIPTGLISTVRIEVLALIFRRRAERQGTDPHPATEQGADLASIELTGGLCSRRPGVGARRRSDVRRRERKGCGQANLDDEARPDRRQGAPLTQLIVEFKVSRGSRNSCVQNFINTILCSESDLDPARKSLGNNAFPGRLATSGTRRTKWCLCPASQYECRQLLEGASHP